MRKKLIGIVLLSSCIFLSSCGNESKTETTTITQTTSETTRDISKIEDKEIKIAVGNDIDRALMNQINDYLIANNLSEKGFSTKEIHYEKNSLSYLDNEAVDFFTLGQMDITRLGKAGYIKELNSDLYDIEKESSLGDIVSDYGYPIAIEDMSVMYYNKTLFNNVDMNSLEAIIAKCEEDSIHYSYKLEDIYYSIGLFYATGCTSIWEINSSGKFINNVDTLNSKEGILALEEIYSLLSSSSYKNSNLVTDLSDNSGIVISSIKNYDSAYSILGNDLGVMKLPSFTASDNKTYQIGSFADVKYLCLSKEEDSIRENLINDILMYLVSDTLSLERQKKTGIIPATKASFDSLEFKNNELLTAVGEEGSYSVALCPTPGAWWTIGNAMIKNTKESTGTKEELAKILYDYANPSKEEELNYFILIGSYQNWTINHDSELILNSNNNYEITITIDSSDTYKMARIVTNYWDSVAGFNEVDDSSLAYLDLALCEAIDNKDGNIYFKEEGSYKIIYNQEGNTISITKI